VGSNQIGHRQAKSCAELVQIVHSILYDENASNKERMDTAMWLANRGFGRPTVAQAPGFGYFTITIDDHDARGNPFNDLPRD
jgi:hypothetical protein